MGFAGSSAWISRERHIFLQSTTRVAASSRGDNVMCLRNVYRPSASEWVTLFPDGGSINRSSAIHVFRAVGRPVVGAPRVRSIERGPNHYNSLFSHSIFKRPSSFRTMASANPTSQSKVFTIVGGGRVGEALAGLGEQDTNEFGAAGGFAIMSAGVYAGHLRTGPLLAEYSNVVIRRGEPIPAEPDGPIIVCTRNDDLQGVVDATPPSRRSDLVFIQNGMLQPWLEERGLGGNTQVLVCFAVAKKGDVPVDGRTDLNPEGLTAAWGPHADAFADRLANGGLTCKVLNKENFQKSMLEKLVWISAFMLVGARHKVSVGEVASNYQQEVGDLIEELAKGGSAALGLRLDKELVERLSAYARSVAAFPTAIKEFPWRNGWFYELSQKAVERGEPDPFPLHSKWLKEVGAI